MFTIIDNVKFEVREKIAEGGMGSVYKAQQLGVEGFSKTVALKTLLAPLSKNEHFIKMFIDEARLVANLVHENIVQIYQLGNYQGSYYFVLEYINGISLHDFIARHAKEKLELPRELAVYIASRIARGLAYAHQRRGADGKPMNIVHCDVCPHNILITTEGLPKLTDFGIARAAHRAKDDCPVSGKLPFMSPEQAAGGEVDFRADLYSLGAVLFHMLANDSIRDLSLDLVDILDQAKSGEILWERVKGTVDPALEAILRKALAADPDARYQDSNQLGRDLEYHIYKDGYGPTIVTLEQYLRKLFPELYPNG